MDTLDERLQAVFLFHPADLRANRGGRLSKRQQTLRATAKSTTWLALAVFVLVMVGTGGIIVFSVIQTSGGGAPASGMLAAAGLIAAALLIVIIVGLAVSRKYIA